MIVVDSSVWIDYFTGKNTPGAERLDSLLAKELFAIGDLMLIEVLQGFRTDKDFRKARLDRTALTHLCRLFAETPKQADTSVTE